jgi:peptide/nickel transport system permease protein
MGSSVGYLGERLITFFATIVISVTVVFFVPRLVPGDPLGAIFNRLASTGGASGISEELERDYRERFGLDKSLGEQYLTYLGDLAQGDLGYSIPTYPTRVSTLLRNAVPWTVGLLGVTTLISWVLGSLLGALVGWSGGRSRLLQTLVPIALVLYTTPYFILALLLISLLTSYWPIFPLPGGAYSVGAQPGWSWDFIVDVIQHGALPALSIILVSLGWWFLSMRSLIISEQGQDHILWAEAKGLPRRRIFWAYAFRNALLPQTTGLALSIGNIVGGALITEVIFAYPGLGYLIYNAIRGSDFPVVQGSVLLLVVCTASANLLIDLLNPLIDPRIRAARP